MGHPIPLLAQSHLPSEGKSMEGILLSEMLCFAAWIGLDEAGH